MPGRIYRSCSRPASWWCALAPASAAASLPSVDSGPRPGPDILYAPAPRAPQLENTGVWKAPPILVSGASAYRDGEFLYQDFLYDDHGARGRARPGRPAPRTDDASSAPSGHLHLPDRPRLRGQRGRPRRAARQAAARRRPLSGSRSTRSRTRSGSAFTIAIGGTADAARAFPHGANVSAPADAVPDRPRHDGRASLDAASGAPVGASADACSVDRARRQFTVRVPHAPLGPRARARCGWPPASGLWDVAAGPLPRARARARRDDHARRGGRPAARRRRSSTSRSASHEPFQGTGLQRVVTDAGAGGATARRASALRRRRPGPVPRRGRLRQAARGRRRRHARAARRRAAGRADEPHPRQPLRDRAGHRLLDRLPGRHAAADPARASCAGSCSPTRSTCRASRCRPAATG